MNSGDLAMSIALTRSGSLTGAVLARATASDTSVEMLVKRIAAGDKLAMQVLFPASHPGLPLAAPVRRQ